MNNEGLIQEKFAHLDQLRQQADELHQELALSLELQALWPEAFNLGSIKTDLSCYDLNTQPSLVRFRIKRTDGEIREFPLWAVSDALLKPHVDQVFTGQTDDLYHVRFRRWLERKREEYNANRDARN